MQFTQTEQKMIERLRKATTSWLRWRRYVVLVLGIFEGLLALWMIHVVLNAPRLTEAERLHFSLTIPGATAICAIVIKYTLRNWNGVPTHTLLLKLLEERNQADSAK